MNIVVIGDEDTVAGFKLAGVHKGHVTHTREEIEKALKEEVGDEEVAVIVITEDVASKARDLIGELYLKLKPVIVTIPSKISIGEKREDPMKEFIRRTIGVEITVK